MINKIRPHLFEIISRHLNGESIRSLAREFGVSHPALLRYKKLPEWAEIESKLLAEKERLFMSEFIEKSRDTFRDMRVRFEELAIAFEQNAAMNLKIAQACNKSVLEKEQNAIRAANKASISSSFTKAAVASAREAREAWETIYGLSEILKAMDKEGLLSEDEEEFEED